MQTQRPILFTGAFCSNQEWIDSILSVFVSVRYLPHFFSPQADSLEILSFQNEFPFIAPQENNPYAPFIEEVLGYKLGQESVKAAFGNSFKQLYQRFVDKYQINKEIKKEIRPFIYDKHGIFLAEWLHKHYQTDVVILIQHPLSFVYNWIENKESMDFDKLFSPKLIKYAPSTLERIELEKEENAFENLQEWEKVIRIWLIFAETILYYQLNYPNWLFFKYEDFREAPERILTDMCDMLDLNYTKEFLIKINETKEARNQEIGSVDPDYIKALINETKEYLTHFYPKNNVGKSMFR